MKLRSKKCIVCGRAIRKRVVDIMVLPVTGTTGHSIRVDVEADLRTKADCARHTNAPFIVAIRRNREGFVTRFGTWDGESFVDRYFCTNSCAQSQGYASADSGQRFTWKNAR